MKNIYMIKGCSGDYEDYAIWNVRAFSSKKLAEEFKVKAEKAAKKTLTEHQKAVDENEYWPDSNDFKSKYDPSFDVDEYDTEYIVERVRFQE